MNLVDLPIQNGDFPVRYVNVYQRVDLIIAKMEGLLCGSVMFSLLRRL